MAKDAAENRVCQKVDDAVSEPDERYRDFPMMTGWLGGEPEELSPLDRPTLDEERTQKFYESPRRDD